MKKLVGLIVFILVAVTMNAMAAEVSDYPFFWGEYTEAVVGIDQASSNIWPTDAASYPNLEDWCSDTGASSEFWYDRTASSTPSRHFDDDILEGYAYEVKTAPQLTMTVDGLDPSETYGVFVVFWDRLTTRYDWHVNAALDDPVSTDEVLKRYDTNNSHVFADETVNGCEGYLGWVTGVSSVSVLLDIYYNPDYGAGGDQRFWLEGVAIVPEPATLVLLGLGGLIGLRRRIC